MRDAIITGVLFITVSTGWYFGYVRPADTARAAIMDCMIAERGDTTRVDYDVCVAALSEG